MIALLLSAAALAAKPAPKEPPPAPVAPAPAPGPAPAAPVSETLVTASLVISVPQQEEAAEAVVEKAKSVGGWFQSRTPQAVSLRVPVEQIDAMVAFAEQQGKVVDKAMARQDYHSQLADLRGRLEARRKMLDEYYKVLDTAGADSIVAVEYQVTQAVAQVETLEGQIRMLEDQAAHARLDVSFQFRDRSAPARDGSSSFAWLNTLNVQDVIGSFVVRTPSITTGPVSSPTPPDGFSAWRKKGRYRASSPDDVLFRIRTVKQKPTAELDFWKEAVRDRMVAAGYKLVSEGEIEADGRKGASIELAAPVGTEDWTYLIVFFPQGKHITVVEAAGQITKFDARREAIDTAIKHLAF
jgi:hypothetical protein